MNAEGESKELEEKIATLEQDNKALLKQVRFLQDALAKYCNPIVQSGQAIEAEGDREASEASFDLFAKTAARIIADLKSAKTRAASHQARNEQNGI